MNPISTHVPFLPAINTAKEIFYSELNNLVRNLPERKDLAILGDFNVRVRKDRVAWSEVIRKHGLGNMSYIIGIGSRPFVPRTTWSLLIPCTQLQTYI